MKIEEYEKFLRQNEEFLEVIREILSNVHDPISDVEKMSVAYLAHFLSVIENELDKYIFGYKREQSVFDEDDSNIDIYQTIILSIYDEDLESLKQLSDEIEIVK